MVSMFGLLVRRWAVTKCSVSLRRKVDSRGVHRHSLAPLEDTLGTPSEHAATSVLQLLRSSMRRGPPDCRIDCRRGGQECFRVSLIVIVHPGSR